MPRMTRALAILSGSVLLVLMVATGSAAAQNTNDFGLGLIIGDPTGVNCKYMLSPDLAVDGAVGLARDWGVDDALIGLTIVAAGTSAPELMASAVAAYRRETDIAVGNVVGSNIFNLLWILGITATVVPLPFEVVNNTDLVMVIASSTLLILALVVSRNSTVSRSYGVLLLLVYLGYVAYLIQRG